MLDSGVRLGADAVIALCMGAKFVFLGRPTLYGAAAGGIPGVKRALSILHDEVDVTLAQIGAPTLADLGPQFLMWERPEDLRRNPAGLVAVRSEERRVGDEGGGTWRYRWSRYP